MSTRSGPPSAGMTFQCFWLHGKFSWHLIFLLRGRSCHALQRIVACTGTCCWMASISNISSNGGSHSSNVRFKSDAVITAIVNACRRLLLPSIPWATTYFVCLLGTGGLGNRCPSLHSLNHSAPFIVLEVYIYIIPRHYRKHTTRDRSSVQVVELSTTTTEITAQRTVLYASEENRIFLGDSEVPLSLCPSTSKIFFASLKSRFERRKAEQKIHLVLL